MKNTILFFALCFGIFKASFCQDYLSQYQHFFHGLQLGKNNSPKTIDLAAPQINPSKFNGMNTVGDEQLDQVEELVRIMQYSQRATAHNVPHWDSLLKWSIEYLNKGILPLLLVDYRYESLSDSFWLKGQYNYDTDSGFLIKKGPWNVTDFKQADAFCFVPMVQNISSNVHSIILDSRFYVSHRNIHSFIALGGDINGKSFSIQPNRPLPIGPISEGLNNIFLYIEADSTDDRFSFNKGIQLAINSALKRLVSRFHLISNPTLPDWTTVLKGLPIDQFDVTTYVTSENGTLAQTGAKVSIHYSSKPNGTPGCLNKPVVFVEGIDFGYRGWPTGCRDGKCGNTGYLDLLKGKQWDVESQSWTDWRSIENSPAVLKQYRDSGFDIVYIDFWDGADFIENNAVVVKEAIKQIQQRLCGKHIHIVGASMGALVAKRALTMLENDTLSQCIHSYTSFDGPHLGANIPLGLQATLNYYASVSGKLRDLRDRMLNRPASKQMLLVHYQNQDQPHEFHRKYMADTNAQAYPKLPWKFSVINGSNQMTNQNADNMQYLIPGDSLMHFNIAQPLFDNIKALAKILGGKTLHSLASVLPESDAKLFLYARGVDGISNGFETVATFKTTYKKETQFWVKHRDESFDHISGGMSDVTATFHNALRKQSWLIFSEKYTSNTCFIPTWSAMASDSVRLQNRKPLNITIGEHLLTLRNTPFDHYYSQSENQDHVYFEYQKNGNADWLLTQLLNTEKNNTDTSKDEIFIGKPYDRFIGDMTIPSGYKLNINGDFSRMNLSPKDQLVISGLNCRTFILGNCQRSEINIQKNAQMAIFSGNSGRQPTKLICRNNATINVDSGSILSLNGVNSELYVGRGCKLNLLDGSTLLIGNGCRLILDENSTLTIGKNVTIKLNGERSLLHIKGSVHLGDKAKFEIGSDSGTALGLLKLSNIQGGFGHCTFKSKGNAKFILSGNDANGSPVIQIEGPIDHSGVFDSINIQRAHIRFGNHSKWYVSGKVSLKNDGLYATEWSTVAQDGIVSINGVFAITNCQFKKLNTGIQLDQNSRCHLAMCTFEECSTAVLTPSNRFFIERCTFRKNNVGIEVHGSGAHDSLISNNFTNNHTGISITGDGHTAPLNCNENTFYANAIGLESLTRTIALRCNIFGYNTTAIKATESTIIAGAHSQIRGEKDTLICGNNTFAYSENGSVRLNYSKLYLDGNNNFLVSENLPSPNKIQISGTIPNLTSTPWNTKNTTLNIGNNYWFPLSVKSSMDSVVEKYLSIGVLDIGGRWFEISLDGTPREKINTLCFDPRTSLDLARRTAGIKEDYDWSPNDAPILNNETLLFKIPNNAKIYGLDGRELGNGIGNRIWSDNLSSGFYLVRFQNENGDWISRRIFYSSRQ